MTVLHFIITHIQTYFLLNPHLHSPGHVLALATPKFLCQDPRISCYGPSDPDGFSALLFVPPAPEVLTEKKKKLSTLAFAHFIPQSGAFTQFNLK